MRDGAAAGAEKAAPEAAHEADGGGHPAVTLRSLIAGHRAAMAVATAAAVLAAILEIGPAVCIALALEHLLAGRADDALVSAAALAGVTLLAVAAQWAAATVSHLVAIDVQAALRRRIGRVLLAAPLGEVERLEAGAVRRVLMEDVERIEDGIAHLMPDLSAAIVAPLVIAAAMLALDVPLALAALAPVLLGFAAFATIMRRDQGATARFSAAQAEVADALQETVSMVPVIKAYDVRESALRRQVRAFEVFRASVGEWLAFSTGGMTAFVLATTSTLLCVLPLGLLRVQGDAIGVPTLVFFVLASFGLTNIGARLFGAMGRLRLQARALSRVSALLALPALVPGRQTTTADAGLRLERVSFRLAEGFALTDISLDIPAGARVALVGPSGAGKTTLARLLLRFHDPHGGRILLGGRDLRELAPETLAAQISAVFQEVFLFSRSIRDNIALGDPQADAARIETAARRACADDFIRALPQAYDTVLGPDGGLSGGQRQRIALARALLRDAPIVVLDEATAYADPESEFELQQALREATRGKTVIAIAHRLSTVRDFDHIVYLDGGRIVEQGTHDVLLARDGAYARQWRAHCTAGDFRLEGRHAHVV